MKKCIRLVMIICACLFFTTVNGRAEILGDYMGVLNCIGCHPKEGKIWKQTKHGNAWENLKTQGEEKQSIPECFMCHVVAYNQDGGFIDMDLTPELGDVQCEACHGPGREHIESGGKPEFIIGKPQEDTCRVCHTKGQDKNFAFEEKMKKIRHRRSNQE